MLIKGELRYIQILKDRGTCVDSRLEEIEEALLRGEKFEEIVEELEKCGNRYRFDYIGSHSGKTTDFLIDEIRKLKQKYFPEPRSKFDLCKQDIICDAKRRDIMGYKKFKDYYYYIGVVDTLLDMESITVEESIELNNIIQKKLKD